MGNTQWIRLIFCLSTLSHIIAYKPVLIIHGILDGAAELDDLRQQVLKAHPGTQVEVLDVFSYYHSLTPLWKQIDVISNLTKPFFANATDGAHVIGFSQGGIVGRGLIQTMDNHKVDTFIALSSPLNGQYGDTELVNRFLPSWMKEDLHNFFYSEHGQRWSIGNFWKDPHHFDEYAEYSDFLAVINNESVNNKLFSVSSSKSNFRSLKKLVLIGGPDDGVISPWQSAHFGCYDKNETVVPMRKLKIYTDDVFGLKTLDKQGRIFECTVPGVAHTTWHKNSTVFEKCIQQYLT